MLTPNYSASIAFLKQFHPARLWVLTAISLDKRSIQTSTFDATREEGCLAWLEAQGGTRNIYFSVGEINHDVQKKAERTDMVNVHYLHVDVDPRAGEDVTAEQARALALLQAPPKLPPPTWIVFSGGGYQAFWALRSPIPIDCSLDKAEEAKRYNLQIEIILSADNCHNVDRILRLPGTINRPDERKIRKGRQAVLATVAEYHPDRIYDISQFDKAAEVQSPSGGLGSTATVAQRAQITSNVSRLNSVDELPAGMSGRGKVVIVQGFDPDEPNKFQGRSEWLFFACCEMVRAGCTDDVIYSVITDPGFRISDSILDKGSLTEKYALRQIERAREDAIDPRLREINERHAVILNWSGKCRIVEEQFDESMQRFRLTKQTFEDFQNRYMNRRVDVGVVNKAGEAITAPLGTWWLKHESRRQYDKIIFAPGQEIVNAYNLWRGFACASIPGDCSLFLAHLKDNIAQGEEKHYDYLIKWMASSVQRPERPGYAAIVFRGGQGTGKSFVAKVLGSLFGRHYMQVTDPKHLVGSFNAHLRDCVLLFGDEAFYAGDKKHESILKMLVTEDMITIEAKGVDAEISGNCIHLMMASNEQWVVPAGFDDRRFFVLDVGSGVKNNASYFSAMAKQMENGGKEALLHHLLSLDLTDFNVREVPKTAALQAQKLHSMTSIEGWWMEKLQEGRVLPEDEVWREHVPQLDLQSDYIEYCRTFNISRRGTSYELRSTLSSFMPPGFPLKYQGNHTVNVSTGVGQQRRIPRPYWYKLPPLESCREFWDAHFGGPYEWIKMTPPLEPAAPQPDIPF